jgi:L-alanine-DL-glutamate epimerase-like enolase superfamily enzyme
VRYVGKPGIASLAMSAVDGALWDLKARLLGLPLVTLLGEVRDRVDVYASGGFTSYSLERLCAQLAGWAEDGMKRVMMKVGRDPAADLARVRAARQAIGEGVELFVDAGGAYTRKQAIQQAARFAELGVSWFEQPVTEDDLEGLRFVRDRVPMDVAPGEHGTTLARFREILEAGAVDVLQADRSRCGGITGFTKVGSLCDARSLRLSSCSAPALHLHACCAVPAVCHMEYFYDHARIERMLFDGALEPKGGMLSPDRTRPGFGIELKRKNAARYAA